MLHSDKIVFIRGRCIFDFTGGITALGDILYAHGHHWARGYIIILQGGRSPRRPVGFVCFFPS